MSQKSPKKPVCAECGSEPLSGALFCFHCGAQLALDDDVKAKKGNKTTKTEEDIIDKPIEPPPGDPFDDQPQSPKEERVRRFPRATADAKRNNPDIRGAAGLGRDSGPMKLRRIETRWMPEDESPNIWFVIAAASLFLVAFGIFLISMYLR